MNASSTRMTEKMPDARSLRTWLGMRNYRRWEKLVRYIDTAYPGVFTPEWLSGGKKHGWYLRYKRSKSFCSLVPERGAFRVLIVFGREERERAEKILTGVTPAVRAIYDGATTYHDGKWVFIPVGQDRLLGDIQKLLSVKRRPSVAAPGE